MNGGRINIITNNQSGKIIKVVSHEEEKNILTAPEQ